MNFFQKITLAALLLAFWTFPVNAAELSFAEAETLIRDTYTITRGCVDIKMLESNALADDRLLMAAALCGIDCMELAPKQLRKRWVQEDAPFFASVDAKYNAAITAEAIAASAVRFTGHSLKKHRTFGDIGIFSDVHYEKGMYFLFMDGLGGEFPELTLISVERVREGYLLHGRLTASKEEGGAEVGTFTVTVAPGDAPGSWKRLSIVEMTQN